MNHNPSSAGDNQGKIFQINRSDGGVPKCGTLSCLVTETGLEGDRQSNTKYHGGIEQAVCLYSLERIIALQEEGHPIYPGSTGENLTVSGLDWEKIVPGTKLWIGNLVLIEITKYTSPCITIAESFLNGNIQRISQNLYPGWSRVYGRVLQTGEIRSLDKVTIYSHPGNEWSE